MQGQRFLLILLAGAFIAACALRPLRAATPVIVQNEAGFEGLEEPTVIYFPDTNTFQNDSYANHVDEGGGLFRDTLRNEYPTPLPPYASGPGWWDGDRNTTNTDRQRSEAKGIVGLGHQGVDQTFEYSFDFRMDPAFVGTGHFCDVFQLKATDGNDGAPLATVALYKSGSTTIGRIDCDGDGTSGTARTFSFTAGQWIHVDIRIATCQSTESTGSVVASINGDSFSGFVNQPIYLTSSTDYRPKFGLYRGMGTDYGVPAGDSWVEHRTVTGYIGTSNVLTWNGTAGTNSWDNNTTQSFLNGASAASFNIDDQINFTDAAANTNVNISGNVGPNYIRFNSTKSYVLSGSGAITGGATLRKDGTGTLTLSTTNSYQGLTDVRAGTLFVTGSVGNSSLVSITGGTLKAGSTTALGSNSTIGTQIDGGTLDINGFNLTTEPISVDGTGASGAGAIVNTGSAQTSALTNVTLTGDTALGGTGRWDIRGTGARLSTGSTNYALTKTGSNQVSLVGAAVDAALGNININQGILGFQTSTSSMGDPTKTVTVATGADLEFFATTGAMNKLCTLNGGTIWGESGTGTQNTFAGAITVNSSGGILDAGSALTGGTPNASAVLNITGAIGGTGRITKNGPGTVTLNNAANGYSGGTTVNAGTLVVANSHALGTGGLSITGSTSVKLQANLGAPVVLTSLSMVAPAPTTTLDLTNNKMVVTNTNFTNAQNTYQQLLGQVKNAFDNFAWDQPGITSSTVATDMNNGVPTSVALVLNNNFNGAGNASDELFYGNGGSLPQFGGVSVDQNSVLLKYTYIGDANLDGRVDSTDSGLFLAGYNDPSLAAQLGWAVGDYDYSGKVDSTDSGLFLAGYNYYAQSGAVLDGGIQPVPEPAGFWLMAIAGVAALIVRGALSAA